MEKNIKSEECFEMIALELAIITKVVDMMNDAWIPVQCNWHRPPKGNSFSGLLTTKKKKKKIHIKKFRRALILEL